MDSRFGRGERLLDHIAPTERGDYARRHRLWGSEVRLADVELAGMNPHGDGNLEVLVKVAWYRANEDDLHSTTLAQTWHDEITGWQLVAERRFDGDPGLLGEVVVHQAPTAARPAAQFPTIRLEGADPAR